MEQLSVGNFIPFRSVACYMMYQYFVSPPSLLHSLLQDFCISEKENQLFYLDPIGTYISSFWYTRNTIYAYDVGLLYVQIIRQAQFIIFITLVFTCLRTKPHSLIVNIIGLIYPWQLALKDSITFPIVQVTSIATFVKMFLFPYDFMSTYPSLHPLIYSKNLHKNATFSLKGT